MSTLPDRDSPELHLVVATPEEIIKQQHANSDEWRGALSLPAYLRREEHLVDQDLTRDGGLTGWALVYQPAGSDEKARQVLCGCETIKKRALVASANAIEAVTAHGVCSVFCPPQYRGKGYASRMIADLGEKLKTWQSNGQNNLFSVLWSDIGKEFYAAHGWKAFPSSHISLGAKAEPPSNLPSVQALKSADLAYLCEADEHSLLSQMSKSAKPTVALVPDLATMSWHHAREEFVAKELLNRVPDVKGAIVNTEQGLQAWCIWTRVWASPGDKHGHTLYILRLVVEDGDDTSQPDFSPATEEGVSAVQSSPAVQAVAALFAAAQKQAAEWDMRTVEFWNPNNVALAAARKLDEKVSVEARDKESICSLRWYGKGSEEDVEWVCNEKFAWC